MNTTIPQIVQDKIMGDMVFFKDGIEMIALGNYALDFKQSYAFLGFTKNKTQVILGDIHTYGQVQQDGTRVIQRSMTMTELDEQIKITRQSKMDSMEFAYEQMDLFSKYLKKNIHSGNGLSANMIMNFVETKDLHQIVDLVLKEVEASKDNFVEGKYRNIDRSPETLLDHITGKLHEKYHRQRIGMEEEN